MRELATILRIDTLHQPNTQVTDHQPQMSRTSIADKLTYTIQQQLPYRDHNASTWAQI